MTNARNRMTVVGLGLFGLILSEQVEAHDFVVTHRITGVNIPQPTCVYTQNSQQTIFVNCSSSAYVFDKDAAEVYVCQSSLVLVVRGNAIVGSPLISADCMTPMSAIPGGLIPAGSKYTFFGEARFVEVTPAQASLALGEEFWVTENAGFPLKAKACFRTTTPISYFTCADATLK
jgi:hypothetical protein